MFAMMSQTEMAKCHSGSERGKPGIQWAARSRNTSDRHDLFLQGQGRRHGKKKAHPKGQREFREAVELFHALVVAMATQICACVKILRSVCSKVSFIICYLKNNINKKAERLLKPADIQRQKNTAGLKALGAGLRPDGIWPERKMSVVKNKPG